MKIQVTNKLINNFSKIEKRYIIILIITAIIFMPYMSNEFIKGDDYICHASNIYAMEKYITDGVGNIIPSKIRPVMAHNMGYGNGIFYPQFSYCITTFIYLIIKPLGGTIIASMKIFEFLIVLLSGIFMYKFMVKVFGEEDIAVTSSIIYICAPYFISDVFHRIAYAEISIFLFLPIVMTSIKYVLDKKYKKFIIYFVIGYTGMICSHLVMTLFFTILVLIVFIINIKKLLNKKTILSFMLASIIIIGITSSFICPMLEHKIRGNYVVFQDESMTNPEKLMANALNIQDIINKNPDRSVTVYISIIVLIFLIITFCNKNKILEKYDENKRKMFWSTVIFTIFAFFMSSKFINWMIVPKILWPIQFPWRMCAFITFGTSVIAGFAINEFKGQTKRIVFVVLCLICLIDASYSISKDKTKIMEDVSYGEVASIRNRAMGGQKEYLPVNAFNNIEYLMERKQTIVIKNGKGEAKTIRNKTPYLQFSLNLEGNENVTVEIPRIFYFGYKIKLKDTYGNVKELNYYENENGLIEFIVTKTGEIEVSYEGTNINKVANIISIITIFVFIIYIIKSENQITEK